LPIAPFEAPTNAQHSARSADKVPGGGLDPRSLAVALGVERPRAALLGWPRVAVPDRSGARQASPATAAVHPASSSVVGPQRRQIPVHDSFVIGVVG
jgi:hypothetical protein